MTFAGKSSWTQPSTEPFASKTAGARPGVARRLGILRTAIAVAVVALTVVVGCGRPGDAAAYKSTSLVCTTLEAGFNYAGDMYTAAQRAGDRKSMKYWATISSSLQGVYLDLDCSYGYYEGPAA